MASVLVPTASSTFPSADWWQALGNSVNAEVTRLDSRIDGKASNVTIATGTGLTGGGDLTANRTLAVDFAASGTSSATKAVRADDARLADARPIKATSTLTGTTDLNTVTGVGLYTASATPTDWAGQHWPSSGRGSLIVEPIIGTTNLIQRWITWATNKPRLYVRAQSSGTWGAWYEVGADVTDVGINALTATSDFDTYTPARVTVYTLAATPTNWQTQHLPADVRGALTVIPLGSQFIQQYVTWETVPRLFVRIRNGGVWQSWTQIGAAGSSSSTSSNRPGSGMKIVGVPLTAGHNGLDAPVAATARLPFLFGAPIVRWRLVIHNINTRSGATRSGSVDVTGVWLGTHSGAGAATGLTQVVPAFTIPDAATIYRTPWVNKPLPADVEHLLTLGYTTAAAPWAMLGTNYQTTSIADAGSANPAGMSKTGLVPFTLALEAETYAHTPVVASFGDSNSVGTGAANVVYDSWLSQLCRRIKALPVHLGSSGDSCNLSQGGTDYKYARFAGLARPDAVIMAMGQNDAAATGVTSAEIKPKIDTVLANLAANVSETVYAVNYMPRTNDPWAGFEAVRRDLNAYLLTQPGGIRDVFDIAAAISNDDETIRPEYDSDGTHLNATGFGAVQAAINRPVTTPPVMYAS